jgi:predicted ATPase/DNA-binding CsgD family transcriptional regulator
MGGGHRTRFEAELSGFVGRRHELAEIERLLTSSRLITLTGPGGIGKTCLAIRAANQLAPSYADGVGTIRVAEVPNRRLLTQAVCAAVGLNDRTRRWQDSVLVGFLRDQQMLLVLDECEHLLEACSVLLTTLLRECPDIKVIVTSRQPLGVKGEMRLRVPPLSTPENPGQVRSPEAALGFDAIRLFVERAAAVQPGFSANDENFEAITELCRRLDGIPLAIELTAVRLDAYSVNQLIDWLNDHVPLFDSGIPRGHERQWSLKVTIDRSFQFLSDPEKALWTRLAVFSGDFGMPAAVFVCNGAELSEGAVPSILGGLVEKSMLIRQPIAGAERYRLLEPMRQYAMEQESFRSEAPELKRRLIEWIADLASGARSLEHQPVNFQRVDLERAHLWSAIDMCLREPVYGPVGLSIFYDLTWYFRSRESLPNALQAVEGLLQVTATDSIGFAKGLYAAGEFSLAVGDIDAAKRHLTESIRVARLLGNAEVVGWCLLYLAAVAWEEGQGDVETDCIQQLVHLSRAMGNELQYSAALQRLGGIQVRTGDVAGGLVLLDEALAITGRLNEGYRRTLQLWNLAVGRMHLGELESAETAAREALELATALGAGHSLAISTECLAWIAAERRDGIKAARLLGAASEMWKSMGAPLFHKLDPYHDRCVSYARTALGPRFVEEERLGARLSRSELIGLATSERPGKLDTPVRPWASTTPRQAALTAREREVARMVATGLTSKEVGAELMVSTRTVETHVGNILTKLGLSSRTQLANWVASRQLERARDGLN